MTTATPTPCVVRDIDGNLYGPFPDAMAAAKWASAKWPDQDQGDDGWEVQVLNHPNE